MIMHRKTLLIVAGAFVLVAISGGLVALLVHLTKRDKKPQRAQTTAVHNPTPPAAPPSFKPPQPPPLKTSSKHSSHHSSSTEDEFEIVFTNTLDVDSSENDDPEEPPEDIISVINSSTKKKTKYEILQQIVKKIRKKNMQEHLSEFQNAVAHSAAALREQAVSIAERAEKDANKRLNNAINVIARDFLIPEPIDHRFVLPAVFPVAIKHSNADALVLPEIADGSASSMALQIAQAKNCQHGTSLVAGSVHDNGVHGFGHKAFYAIITNNGMVPTLGMETTAKLMIAAADESPDDVLARSHMPLGGNRSAGALDWHSDASEVVVDKESIIAKSLADEFYQRVGIPSAKSSQALTAVFGRLAAMMVENQSLIQPGQTAVSFSNGRDLAEQFKQLGQFEVTIDGSKQLMQLHSTSSVVTVARDGMMHYSIKYFMYDSATMDMMRLNATHGISIEHLDPPGMSEDLHTAHVSRHQSAFYERLHAIPCSMLLPSPYMKQLTDQVSMDGSRSNSIILGLRTLEQKKAFNLLTNGMSTESGQLIERPAAHDPIISYSRLQAPELFKPDSTAQQYILPVLVMGTSITYISPDFLQSIEGNFKLYTDVTASLHSLVAEITAAGRVNLAAMLQGGLNLSGDHEFMFEDDDIPTGKSSIILSQDNDASASFIFRSLAQQYKELAQSSEITGLDVSELLLAYAAITFVPIVGTGFGIAKILHIASKARSTAMESEAGSFHNNFFRRFRRGYEKTDS